MSQTNFGVLVQSYSRDIILNINHLSEIDFIIIDCQHGFWTETQILDFFHHVRNPNIFKYVRTGIKPNISDIGKYLDAGAEGLVIPFVEHSEEIEKINKYSLYPPQGLRSIANTISYLESNLSFNEYKNNFNEKFQILPLIETKKGLSEIKDIYKKTNNILFGIKDLMYNLEISMGETEVLIKGLIKQNNIENYGVMGVKKRSYFLEENFVVLGSLKDLISYSIKDLIVKYNRDKK